MTVIKAADLPEGSVVSLGEMWCRWTKRWGTPGGEWQDDNCELAGNGYIDELMRLGAQVLRHGYGDGEQS